MSLLIPTHVARAAEAASRGGNAKGLDLDDLFLGEHVPLKAIPDPARFNVIVKQVNLRKKIGSIEIPDTVLADQQWHHGMGLVVKVGPSVYRGAKFADVGLTPEDGPKVGELWWFTARAPLRLYVDNELYMLLSDDGLNGKFDRYELDRVRFT
jgi:hypothetical protein